ncbi:MAG: 5-bromo-4-chloroindolyl phosphate hydrolysis family protein [Clostridia bacterium]|nr:5-bromo-4-chloroindolyl phosphate hydrolysis family protein [Clostridia bacterium]
MKAKEILKKLDYVPRWIWYAGGFFVAPPVGLIAVYILFHALEHAASVDEEEEQEEVIRSFTQRRRKGSGNVVSGEGYEVRDTDTAAPSRAAQFSPIDPEAGVDEVLRRCREAMVIIREENDRIPDPVLSTQIDSIEKSCGQILSMLEQRPELLPQLRTFLRYYLPTTLKLLDARARLDNAGTPKGREVRRRIGKALSEVDRAFKNQVEALEEYRFVDLESEMDVLSEMLRSDGLIAEDDEDEQRSMPSHG